MLEVCHVILLEVSAVQQPDTECLLWLGTGPKRWAGCSFCPGVTQLDVRQRNGPGWRHRDNWVAVFWHGIIGIQAWL